MADFSRGGVRRGAGRDYRRPQNMKKTILRLLGYVGRHWMRLAVVLVMMCAASLSAVAASYLLKPIVDECILPNVGAEHPDWMPLLRTLILLGIVYAVGVAASYGQTVLMVALSNRTIHSIRRDLFEHLEDMPASYFDTTENGELMSRFTNDADAVQLAVEQTLPSFLTSAITFLSIVAIMLRMNAVLFGVILLFVIAAAAASRWLGAKSKSMFRRQQSMLGQMNAYMEEMIEGMKVVKAFCHEKQAGCQFGARNEAYRQAATEASFLGMSMMPVVGQIMAVGYVAVTVAGALFVLSGSRLGGEVFTVGSLGVFLTYTKQLRSPINQISNQVVTLMSALAGAERMFQVMDLPVETDEGTVTLAPQSGGMSAWQTPQGIRPLSGEIRFENVSFHYDPDKPVLRDLSLTCAAGMRIALVGSTGAGKTTVTNLITRFYEVQEGCIRCDGIDIRDIRKEDLRNSIAVVLQDTHLFSGTVLDNIRYGRMEATEEECIEAAKAANAYEFIMKLPQGFSTQLSGDGENLSQGQRQLLNIARAVASRRPILILDEATSSVDTRTERMIEQGLEHLMTGRTVLVIAHRLSTVRGADRIAVIEHGSVVEFGTHQQLLDLGGRYSELYNGQAVLL